MYPEGPEGSITDAGIGPEPSEGWGFRGIPSRVDSPQRLSNRKEVLEGATGLLTPL